MRFIKSKVIFLIITGFVTGALCERGAILFLCSRINYAWGYMHGGWFIDSSGAIYNYSFAESDDIDHVYLAEHLPRQIYEKILAKGVLTGKNVPIDTLLAMEALIEPATNGTVTYIGRCMDAGIFRYSAINYNVCDSCEREIICYQTGDAAVCNSSLEARKIGLWLNSIDSVNLRSCAPPDSCLNITTSIMTPVKVRRESGYLTIKDNSIHFVNPQAGIVVIRAYTFRGELAAKPIEQLLTAGEYQISMAEIVSGISEIKPVIVEISGVGMGSTMRTVIFSH